MLNFNLFIISSFNMFFVCDIAVEGMSISGKYECTGPGCLCVEVPKVHQPKFGKDTCNSVSYCNLDAETGFPDVGECQLNEGIIAKMSLTVLGVVGIGLCVLALVVFKEACCNIAAARLPNWPLI